MYQYKVKIQLNSCMLVDERFNGWKTDNNSILWSCVADFYPNLRNLLKSRNLFLKPWPTMPSVSVWSYDPYKQLHVVGRTFPVQEDQKKSHSLGLHGWSGDQKNPTLWVCVADFYPTFTESSEFFCWPRWNILKKKKWLDAWFGFQQRLSFFNT